MAHFNPDDFSRYSKFNIHTTTYKTVSEHPIACHVLIPKTLSSAAKNSSEPRPVILRFHGGGLVGASGLFPDFFAPWLLELASRNSAVIVSPDYRMIPESSIGDLIEDVEDSLKWTLAELPGFVRGKTDGKVDVNTSQLLAAGESAGGYLSLLTALNHPKQIRSVTAAYPMVDLLSPYFTEDYDKPIFGMPQIPYSVIEEHLKNVKQGEAPSIVSSDPRFERASLMFCLFQRGGLKDFFTEKNPEFQILEKLKGGARFPKGGVFVYHGKNDSLVPAEGSTKLAELVRELDPTSKFHLEFRDGEHGFDGDASLDDEWIANGVKDVTEAWLA